MQVGKTSRQKSTGYTQDGGRPVEGQAQGGAGGRVYAEIEQEAAYGGDDKKCRHGEAFEVEGRHAVQGAKRQAQGIEARDGGPKIAGAQREARHRKARHQQPGHSRRQLACYVQLWFDAPRRETMMLTTPHQQRWGGRVC